MIKKCTLQKYNYSKLNRDVITFKKKKYRLYIRILNIWIPKITTVYIPI